MSSRLVVKFGSAAFACAAVAALAATAPAQAAPITFEFNDTIKAAPYAELSAGDSARVTITFDNGIAGNQSQTWTPDDVVSITFDFNDGALVTSFFPPGNGFWFFAYNNFRTDAAGNLIEVVDEWNGWGVDNPADYETNGPSDYFSWILTGSSAIYFESGRGTVEIENGPNLNNPAYWSEVKADVVPAPGALALLGLGLAGLGIMRRVRTA